MTASGAVVLAAVLLGAGCGGDEDEAGRSSTTEERAPATTAPGRASTTSEAPSDEPQPLPSSGDLEPGTYVTEDMQPTVTVAVEQGWAVLFDDREDNLALGFELPAQPTPSTAKALGLVRLTNTFDNPLLPFSVMLSPTERAGHIVPVPDDLVAWLKTIPGAVVGDVTELEVAGHPAQRFEVTFQQSAGDGSPGSCPPEIMDLGCVFLFSVESGVAQLTFTTEVPSVFTVIALPDGERMLATFDAPVGQLSAFTESADEVLRTLEIG